MKQPEESVNFTGTLETLTEMMQEDGRNNHKYGSRVLWWVSVAVSDVLPSSVNAVIKGFGLPTDTDSCFYNEFLSQERETRIRIGEGKIKNSQTGKVTNVKSLNLFIQSLWYMLVIFIMLTYVYACT